MSDKALRIIVCDIGPGGDQCAPGFRSTTATLLNKEGAFNRNGGSRSRALREEKSADDDERAGRLSKPRAGAGASALFLARRKNARMDVPCG
jgi:hypothetical protein